ncbi:TraR/DksA C4-type zinc finger protein [Acidisoma sp. 7E03]
MDEADQAQRAEELYRASALHRAVRPVQSAAAALTCRNCGEDIPEARRQAVPGARLCVECQAAAEEARP